MNGNLNLSRSIGDLKYKANSSLPPSDQMITAEPDVLSVEVADEDRFMILACDGVWDCMTSQQVREPPPLEQPLVLAPGARFYFFFLLGVLCRFGCLGSCPGNSSEAEVLFSAGIFSAPRTWVVRPCCDYLFVVSTRPHPPSVALPWPDLMSLAGLARCVASE